MSYARMSSGSIKSDIYLYSDVDGYYQLHIAHCRKHVSIEEPSMQDVEQGRITEEVYRERWRKFYEAVTQAECVPIQDDFAGQSISIYQGETQQDHINATKQILGILYELRARGYHIPDYTLTRLEAELDEMRASMRQEILHKNTCVIELETVSGAKSS